MTVLERLKCSQGKRAPCKKGRRRDSNEAKARQHQGEGPRQERQRQDTRSKSETLNRYRRNKGTGREIGGKEGAGYANGEAKEAQRRTRGMAQSRRRSDTEKEKDQQQATREKTTKGETQEDHMGNTNGAHRREPHRAILMIGPVLSRTSQFWRPAGGTLRADRDQ